MSKNIDTGGTAFPANKKEKVEGAWGISERIISYSGMTVLDYFAAKAMQGLLIANHPALEWRSIAKEAYLTASAMLVEKRRIENEQKH